MIYAKGQPLKKVPTDQLVEELFKEIDRYYAAGKQVVVDRAKAAEAAQWLSENEDDTAVTPERLAAAEKEAAEKEAAVAAQAAEAAAREAESPVAGRRFTRI
jgi:(E)-4-hydroxy-3-methylbut-2-enyl-diphosphate synthase